MKDNIINKKIQPGFTLVELLLVIAIISILAAIAMVGVFKYTENAKKSTAIANARTCITNVAQQLANNPLSTPIVTYCTANIDTCTCVVDGHSATCSVSASGDVTCS